MTGPQVAIEFENMARLEQAIKAAPRRSYLALREAMMSSLYRIEADAKRGAPVDTGRLRASIHSQMRVADKTKLVGIVGSKVFYAPYMEFGTGRFAGRDRHWPPGAALETWAKRHGMDSGYRVARAIGMRGGLEGRLYLTKAFEGQIAKVRDEFRQAILKILRRTARA